MSEIARYDPDAAIPDDFTEPSTWIQQGGVEVVPTKEQDSWRKKAARMLGIKSMQIIAVPSQPFIDKELFITTRQKPVDSKTGTVISSDWHPSYHGRYVSNDELDTYLQNEAMQKLIGTNKVGGWVQYELSVPVIVDEYGYETCFEPTEQQIALLAEQAGEDPFILKSEARRYANSLMHDGRVVLDEAADFGVGFRDEIEIARLFKEDADTIREEWKDPKVSARKNVRSRLYLDVFAEYPAPEDLEVTIIEQGGKNE